MTPNPIRQSSSAPLHSSLHGWPMSESALEGPEHYEDSQADDYNVMMKLMVKGLVDRQPA
jgi:hypothetical protein